MLLDAQGVAVLDRLCLLRRSAKAEPRAVGDGTDEESAPAARCGSRWGTRSTASGRRQRSLDAIGRSSSAPAGPVVRTSVTVVRVLAAMSGGVDSAVAAARAVEAGPRRDRGAPRLVESSPPPAAVGRAAAAPSRTPATPAAVADVIGIPFYVWDLAETVPQPTSSTTSSPSTPPGAPQPLPALQREDQVRGSARPGAGALGFDAVCTGHYARGCRPGRRGGAARASTPARTSPTCSAS